MLLIPAIDLKEGQCVRLRQGRMDDDTVFSNDPVAVAARWVEEGARRLHIVDLDGAFAGEPKNADVVRAISRRFPDIPIQIGGGIRSFEIAEAYIEAGVSAVIIGTLALTDPDIVSQLCKQLPDRVIVGLDAKNGFVATDGWENESEVKTIDLARHFEGVGVNAIVYTDISRDGMLQGVNIDATKALADAINIPVIASGGVTDISDIQKLCAVADAGISGVIIGRALYEGTLDLATAQQLADSLATMDDT